MDVPRHWRSKSAFYRLEGVACQPCGRVSFPPRDICPGCGSSDLGPTRLSGRGAIHTHARVYSAPEGDEGGAPYDVALIALDEGPLVTARLTDFGETEVAVGAPVEMVTRRLAHDGPEGVVLYGYAFRPRFSGPGRC